MATMRAMQVAEKGGDFELVEREVPTPGEALVRVHACGVCHSDMLAKEGAFPGEALQALGGAEVILTTISSGSANSEVLGGLGPFGELTVSGHASGTSMDPRTRSPSAP